ncbi:MAG: TrmB family transcriptional regulator [Promethearchaeota archaeon]
MQTAEDKDALEENSSSNSNSEEDTYKIISKNLQTLGFTINDSRIYVCLLKIGLSSPAKISEKSHVDRARVYDSLKRLVKRGIVEEEPVQRAPRYRAIPPEKVFNQIRLKLKKKIKLSQDLEKQLKNIKIKQNLENSSVWSIQSESKIRKQVDQLLEEAQEFCFIIWTFDDSPAAIREFEALNQTLLEKKRNNPNMQINIALNVFPENKDHKAIINRLFHANIEIYRWNTGHILPFGLYLTENAYLQTYLSKLDPRPSYTYGIFMENANQDQIVGFKVLSVWVFSHLCQKVVFTKKK